MTDFGKTGMKKERMDLNNNYLTNQLKTYFGFDKFKKGQEEVISKIITGQSSIAIFPTGAGKSICYQLSSLLLPHMTLVVSPLLSLMKDQVDFLIQHNIAAARLDSTISPEEYNNTIEAAKNGDLKILMISVERFKNERFRIHLKQMKISLMVIDEAHCISEWGHNFRPDYMKLPLYQKEFQIDNTLLMTATAIPEVVKDMCDKFNIPEEHVVITGFYRDNLFLQVTPVDEDKKKELLIERIQKEPEEPTIVYVTKQKTAEEISEYLVENNIQSSPYHAGMQNENREKIQSLFMAGDLDCVVATIAFGMGIDKKNIRRIIHYDLPKSIENYSQEIGRAGRDGKNSLCEVFGNTSNINVLENFIYGDTPERDSIKKLLRMIQGHEEKLWEVKLFSLSFEIDIRIIPLKTLLVYLELEKIILPQYTRFDEYKFKFNIGKDEIVNNFKDERKKFVEEIFSGCDSKRVWTYMNINEIEKSYNKTDRERIIKAVEYFSEKGWIELTSGHSIEVFEIISNDFNLNEISDKIYSIFKNKELHEIQRIHSMVSFFESDSCLSKILAEHFGEILTVKQCGHCSHCLSGKAGFQSGSEPYSLNDFNFDDLSSEFKGLIGEKFSPTVFAKFLCGIATPVFSRQKITRLDHFGTLEKYPFSDVIEWCTQQSGPKGSKRDRPAEPKRI